MHTHIGRILSMVMVACAVIVAPMLIESGAASAATFQCNGTYVKSVTQGASVLSVEPTTFGRWAARSNTSGAWAEVSRCSLLAPFSARTIDSFRTQFDCHAFWSAGAFGRYTGGATWDLESWRVPTRNLWTWTYNKCNW